MVKKSSANQREEKMAGVASSMDSQLYKTVVTIVDERIKEIKVTRKDFDDLKSVVGELAEAQKRTEIKVEELAEAQKRTEIKVEELAEAQRASETRLGRLEVVVGELAEAQKRTEVTLQGLTKEVGALSRNFGFGLEDIGHVVLPGYLKRHYRIDMGEFEKKFFEVNGKLVEINFFAEGRIIY